MQTRKGSRDVILNRPDKLRMKYVYEGSPQKSLNFWYDGTTATLESPLEKVYARTKMPPNLDDMLDYAGITLDTPMAMADLFYSSPYESYMSPETSGTYVKLEQIGKLSCHQLAFQSPLIDYRIWVADGSKSFPCQIELIYKMDEGSPKTLISFSDWNFSPAVAADTFAHEPPADFKKIKIVAKVPVEDPSTQTQPQTQE